MSEGLDPTLLRTLVTVAELASITGAAKALGLTQSTASLQIQRLEEQLGVCLLTRSRRGVQLTAEGNGFLVYAKRILALSNQAMQSVRAAANRRVRIGMTDVQAIRYLPGLLVEFSRAYPDIQPTVTCDISTLLVERFERGELDVCLFVQHGPETRGVVVGQDHLCWVASPDLELASHDRVPLIVYPEYCIYRSHALRALAEVERDWEIVYCSQSTAAIDIAINQVWGVAIKASRTLDPTWRVLTEDDGLPPLDLVRIELRRSPTRDEPWIQHLGELLERRVRDDLAS